MERADVPLEQVDQDGRNGLNNLTDWWLPRPGTLLRAKVTTYYWCDGQASHLREGDIVIFMFANRSDLVVYETSSIHVDFQFLDARGKMQNFAGGMACFELVGDQDQISKDNFFVFGPFERSEFDEGPFDYGFEYDDLDFDDPWEKF